MSVSYTHLDVYKRQGNGRLDAVSNAIKLEMGYSYALETYTEHSLEDMGSGSQAVSYIGLKWKNGSTSWGAGLDTDIIRSGIKALVSAINNKPVSYTHLDVYKRQYVHDNG